MLHFFYKIVYSLPLAQGSLSASGVKNVYAMTGKFAAEIYKI